MFTGSRESNKVRSKRYRTPRSAFTSIGEQADAVMLKKHNVPMNEEIDVVAQLERDLREDTKNDIQATQSQQLGSSGITRPDIPGDNEYLIRKAEKYAQEDNVHNTGKSKLGDFSLLLDMQSMAATQNSGLARNQTMAMAFSTLRNKATQAESIVESQMAYNLAASSFGLKDKDRVAVKQAIKRPKFGNNTL